MGISSRVQKPLALCSTPESRWARMRFLRTLPGRASDFLRSRNSLPGSRFRSVEPAQTLPLLWTGVGEHWPIQKNTTSFPATASTALSRLFRDWLKALSCGSSWGCLQRRASSSALLRADAERPRAPRHRAAQSKSLNRISWFRHVFGRTEVIRKGTLGK